MLVVSAFAVVVAGELVAEEPHEATISPIANAVASTPTGLKVASHRISIRSGYQYDQARPHPMARTKFGAGRAQVGGRRDPTGAASPLSPNWCPRQDSNLRTWFRKPLLYPLSYGGNVPTPSAPAEVESNGRVPSGGLPLRSRQRPAKCRTRSAFAIRRQASSSWAA